MKMIILSSICESSGVLRTINILNIIVTISKIVIPIIIIISGIIIFGKAAISNEQDEIKKSFTSMMKKIVAGLIIFVLPSIFTTLLSLVNDYTSLNEKFSTCNECLKNSNNCQTLIIAAEKRENNELSNEEKEEYEKARQNEKKQQEKVALSEAQLIKMNEPSSQKPGDNINNNEDPNLNYSNGSITLNWNDVTKISNLTPDQLTNILNNCSKFSGKAKRFAPYASDIIAAERKYGVNAFYLISIYALESGWAGSELTKTCNNLGGVKYNKSQTYGPNLVHTVPCGKENKWAGFESIGGFIDYHAKLLGTKYLVEGAPHYHGKTPEGVVQDYCPGGGESYTNTIKNIGTGLFETSKNL